MFLNFLVRKCCTVCQKIDRSSLLENNLRMSECINNEFNSEEQLCTCTIEQGFYYKSTKLLRAIQTIALVLIFITTISTLFMVRNAPSLNAGVSTVVSGYSSYKRGLNDFRSEKNQEQLAKRFVEFEQTAK